MRTYLDHAATTPLLPQARTAMIEGVTRWANPSSPHREGRAARAVLEAARERIKAALGWRHELIFTSGATEAAAIAMRRTRAQIRAVSTVEHAAVLLAAGDAVTIAVDALGRVTTPLPPADLVAVQQVNSETGVLQPLERIAAEVHAAGGLLFADCAQGAGKQPLPPADLIALSAHKLGGPPGVGALLARDLALLVPAGQGQEQGYRPGTENLPAILGFAAAVEAWAAEGVDWMAQRAGWRVTLEERVRAAGGEVIAAGAERSPLIASYRLPGLSAAAQLMRLDAAGFAVSAGSACSSGTMRPSHVLAALGLEEAVAGEVIRVSFGQSTTVDEVHRFADAWTALAAGRQPRAA